MSAGRLVSIDRANWRRALQVGVTDDQLRFVADHQPIALVILAKAFVGVGGWEWEPLVFETDADEIVGVLGLATDANGSRMFNLAIDHRSPRSGFGAAAVAAVIERIRTRSALPLSLTVHPDNHGRPTRCTPTPASTRPGRRATASRCGFTMPIWLRSPA